MFEGSKYAYYGMYLVGFAIMMLVNLKTHKKYELKKSTAVIFTLITYGAGVFGAMKMGEMYTYVVRNFEDQGSTVAIFGAVFFTPLIMTAVALLLNQSWRKIMDLLAPGIFIILACAKFGCFMAGCCHRFSSPQRQQARLGAYTSPPQYSQYPAGGRLWISI